MKQEMVCLVVFGCAVSMVWQAWAADIQKADNEVPLNEAASWVGGSVPGAADKAVFGALDDEDRAVAFGADAAWRGIVVADSTNTWTLTGPAALALGADGVSSDGNLTLDDTVSLTLGATQLWRIGSQQRRWDINAPIHGAASATLTKTGYGTLSLPCDNLFEGAFHLGHANATDGSANSSLDLLNASNNSGGFVVVGTNGSLGRGTLRFRGAQIVAAVPGLVIPNDGFFESGAMRVGGTNDLTFSGAMVLALTNRDLGNYLASGCTLSLTGPIDIAGYTFSLRSNSSLVNTTALHGPLIGTGLLTLNGDFANSTAYVTADNAATFSGTTEILGGTLAITHPDALGGGAVRLNADNTQFALADGIVFTNTVTINNGSQDRTLRPLAGASAEFAGPIISTSTFQTRVRLYAGEGETLTVSGPITSASGAGITKANLGVLVLPNAQAFTDTFYTSSTSTANISPTLAATPNSGGTIIIGHGEAFGCGTLSSRGAQIRAAVPGLTVTNSVFIEGGGFRFNGEHDLTFSGPVTMSDSRSIANYSRTSTLTLTGPLTTLPNRHIEIIGVPNAPANGTVALMGPVGGEGHIFVNEAYNNGLLILGGANTFPGMADLNGGTLRLDYSAEDNPKLSDSAPLLLNGVTAIELSGGTHLEQVGGTAVYRPAVIRRLSGAAVLALGDLTFKSGANAAGGMLHLAAPGIASTTSTNVNGILPNVTVAQPDGTTAHAMVSSVPDGAGGFLIAAASMAFDPLDDIPHFGGTLPDDPALNARIVDGGTDGPVTAADLTNTVSTITVTAAEAPTVLALDPAALLAAASVTLAPDAADFTLGDTPGTGRLSSPFSTLALINNEPSATLRVNAAIADSADAGRVALVKRGPGTVLLASDNPFSGGLAVEEGMLQIGDGTVSGTWGTNLGYVRNNGTLFFNLPGAGTHDVNVSISGTGRIVKDGKSSTLRLNGRDSTFSGGLEINGGTLVGRSTPGSDQHLNLGTGPITISSAQLNLRANGTGSNRTIVTGDGYTPNDATATGAVTINVDRYDAGNARTGNTFLLGALTLGADTALALISDNAYSIAFAKTATLLGNVTLAQSEGANVSANAQMRFDAPVTDNGQGFGFTKTGRGVLALNAPSAISGQVRLGTGAMVTHTPETQTLTIDGGVVALGHSDALGTGPLVMRGAQIRAAVPGIVITNSITIEGGGFRCGGTNDLAFTGLITATGATRGIGNYTRDKTLTIGPINMNGWNVNFEGIDNNVANGSNGTTVVRGPIFNTGAAGAEVVLSSTLFDGGTAVIAADCTYPGATRINPGTTLVLGDGGTEGSLNLASTLYNSGTLAFNRADAITQGVHFATALGTLGGISQRGTGRVVITSGITCSGTVHVAEESVLEFTGSARPHPESPMQADGTFALAWDADTALPNAVSGAGCLALEGGAAATFDGDLCAFTGLVRVTPGAAIAAGEADLPNLTLDPGAGYRWNVSDPTNDTLAVTGDLTLPPDGFTLDIRRAGSPRLKGRVLFTYGGAYDGPEECPLANVPAYVALHDATTQTLYLKPKVEGTILLLK